MPATTQGFQIQNMPRVDYQPVSALTPAYGNILPSAGQGLGLFEQYDKIGDNAITDPLHQQLLAAQVQDMRNRAAMAPLEQQLRLAQISEAQQNAAVPHQFADNVGITGGVNVPQISSPAGTPFENITFKDSYLPEIKTTTGREIGAGGVVKPYTKNEMLLTGEQVRAAAAKVAEQKALQDSQIAYQKSHAAYLDSGGRPDHVTQLISSRDAAIQAGDTKTADQIDAIINSLPKAQALKMQTPDSVHGIAIAKMAAEIGVPPDVAAIQVKTPAGASAFAKRYMIQKAIQNGHFLSNDSKTFTPEELAAEVAARSGVAAPTTGSYPTADAVKAAVRSGQLTREQGMKILSDQFGFTP